MPELLFLLLPVAALYGYIMGRNSFRQQQLKQHEKINQNFLSGLNLFLNNQRDKAIDTLIENLEVNNETFTTHVALGKLFRAKGENDRAIKIHQFLAKQDTLSPEQRQTSIMQLAKDYVDCALYDRAEALLLPLTKENDFSYEACTILSQIYQVFRDWQQAYDILKDIKSQDDDSLDNTRAYLLCELAEKKESEDAKALLLKALSHDKSCARAYFDLIDLCLADNATEQAQSYACQLCSHTHDYIPLLVPKLDAIYPDKEAQFDYLTKVNAKCPSSAIAGRIAHLQSEKGDHTEARKSVIAMLQQHATIQGFSNLLELNAKKIDSDETRQMMLNLNKMVVNKINKLPDVECEQCGYQGSFLFWQCPRCKNWGSIKPIKGLTGD